MTPSWYVEHTLSIVFLLFSLIETMAGPRHRVGPLAGRLQQLRILHQERHPRQIEALFEERRQQQ